MLPAYEDLRLKRRAVLVLGGACLAIFFTSSEFRNPVISLGFVGFTSSELAAGFFFLTAIVWAAADRSRFFSRLTLDLAVVMFVAVNFLSAATAADRPSVLKFSLRMTYAALVYLGISRLPGRARSYLVIGGAAAATLGLVAVVGLFESYAWFGRWTSLLSPWHEGTITFGANKNVRVSSILPYPTTLSMYLELMYPLALAFGLWLVSKQGAGFRRLLLYAGIVAGTAAVMVVQINTLTRTALVAMPVSLLAGAVLALLFRYTRRVAIFFALAASMLIAILGIYTMFSNKVAERVGAGEQVNGFNAAYEDVQLPELRPGGEFVARVRIRNLSEVYWQQEGDEQIIFIYFWRSYPGKDVVTNVPSKITKLPTGLGPRDSQEIDVVFHTPETPGSYLLIMELAKNNVGPFSWWNVPPLVIPLEFDELGARRFAVQEKSGDFTGSGSIEPTPSRSQLWPAALRAWKLNPVLGVGADQFRKRYSETMPGLPKDERVASHNIFLEALANTGIVGLAVMFFLLGSAAWRSLQLVRERSISGGARLMSLALIAALTAYVIHGLLDYFLWQTGVAFVFFAELGLISWLYQKRDHRGRADI